MGFDVLPSKVAKIKDHNKVTASDAGRVTVVCETVGTSKPSLNLVVSDFPVHPVRLDTLLVSSVEGDAGEAGEAGTAYDLLVSSAIVKGVLDLSTRKATA